MLVATVVAVLGLACSVAAVQVANVRLSGVVAVPLASVYVLYEFAMLPILVGSVAVAYGAIALLRRRTFLFGQQLLLAGIVVGAVVPIAAVWTLESVPATGPLRVAFVGSILPGIAAYNYARQDRADRRLDVGASLAALVGLVLVGGLLVMSDTASLLGAHTPPILFAEGSDVAALRDVAVESANAAAIRPGSWTTLALLGGIGLNELLYDRWGVRLTGMVALPLVALFTLYDPVAVPLYAVGLLATFALVSAIAQRTLVYGRVLLSAGIAIGVVLGAVAGAVGTGLPGFALLFLGLFAGLGGYNLHRVPSPERPAELALSAATFVGFAALFHGIDRGAVSSLSPALLVAVGAVVLATCWVAVGLERARRGSPRGFGVIGA